MLKTILLIVAVCLSTLAVYLSWGILWVLIDYLQSHPLIAFAIGIAVLLQLAGHVLRAKRTKLITDQAASSSVQFQFGTLSTGYLFNTLLPFRVGELIRALLVAKRLQISFLYTFTAILIERVTDVLFLGIIILVGIFFFGGIQSSLLMFISVVIVISIVVLYGLMLLKNENKFVLNSVSRLSGMFNTKISNSIRFKVWSLIFGLQHFFNNKKLVRLYISYALASWLFYITATLVIVMALLPPANIIQQLATSVAPYIISFNPVDLTSYLQLVSFMPISEAQGAVDIYARAVWAVLVLPMAIIGIIALVLYHQTPRRKEARRIRPVSYENKLLRQEDISQEFPAFLETYFKGHNLTRILHKIELNGELSLIKFFKGGSDAITVLAMKDEKLFVKKIVPAEYTNRLRVQYEWLQKYDNKKAIVDVLAEQKTDDYYAIDLAYDPENIALFEYVHTRSLKQSKQVIDDVWSYVFKNVYKLEKESVNTKERDIYVRERLLKKVEGAVAVNADLRSVIEAKKVIINGESYDNFNEIIHKIKKHKQAWTDIATYRKSVAIHGDLTVDNILVDTRTDKPVIIDPSDDNQVRGPIIDYARHTQSLVAGYEFLNSDDSPTVAQTVDGVITINYYDHRSARYMQLYDYVSNDLSKKYLTDTERRTVLFHTGLLYGRMLAHRVVINPNNTLKYYAVSVVLLNKFYRQYTGK